MTNKSKPYRECHYCQHSTNRGEWDHFPRPQAAAGVDTVWACRSCHNHKDRYEQTDGGGPIGDAVRRWLEADRPACLVLAATSLGQDIPAAWPWDNDPTVELMHLFDRAPDVSCRIYVARLMRVWWTALAEGRAVVVDADGYIVDKRSDWSLPALSEEIA